MSFLPVFILDGIRRPHNLLVLCFHDVSSLANDPRKFSSNLNFGESEFIDLIKNLKANGYTFVSIGDFEKNKVSGSKNLLLTFDDCYFSFIGTIKTFCESENIPYLVFLCPSLAQQVAPWWVELDLFIQKVDSFAFNHDGSIYTVLNNSKINKWYWYSHLSTSFKNSTEPRAFNDFLAINSEARYQSEITTNNYRINLTFENFREFEKSPMCSLGSHGFEHLSSSKLSTEAAVDNFVAGQMFLRNIAVKKTFSIAFPYGHRNSSEEFKVAARQSGIINAFSTRLQYIDTTRGSDFEIGRLVMTKGLNYRKLRVIDSAVISYLFQSKPIRMIFDSLSN